MKKGHTSDKNHKSRKTTSWIKLQTASADTLSKLKKKHKSHTNHQKPQEATGSQQSFKSHRTQKTTKKTNKILKIYPSSKSLQSTIIGEHPRLMFAVFFAFSNCARKEKFHFSCQLLGGPEPTTEAFSIFQLCWGWLCPWFLKMGMSQLPRGSRKGRCFSMFLNMFWIGNQVHSYIVEEGEAMRDTRPRLWIFDCDWRWRVCIFCCHAGSKMSPKFR